MALYFPQKNYAIIWSGDIDLGLNSQELCISSKLYGHIWVWAMFHLKSSFWGIWLRDRPEMLTSCITLNTNLSCFQSLTCFRKFPQKVCLSEVKAPYRLLVLLLKISNILLLYLMEVVHFHLGLLRVGLLIGQPVWKQVPKLTRLSLYGKLAFPKE